MFDPLFLSFVSKCFYLVTYDPSTMEEIYEWNGVWYLSSGNGPVGQRWRYGDVLYGDWRPAKNEENEYRAWYETYTTTVVRTPPTSMILTPHVRTTALEDYRSKNVVRYVIKKKQTRWYVKFSSFDQDEEIINGKCWVVQCNADMEPKSGMFKVNVSQLKAVQKR
jgi:hypothetical protein